MSMDVDELQEVVERLKLDVRMTQAALII